MKRGFGIVKILVVIAAVAALAGGGYWYYFYYYLPRYGERPPLLPINQQQDESIETDTSTWKTYRNEQYGFEVKYPANWTHRMDENSVFIDDGNYHEGTGFAIGIKMANKSAEALYNEILQKYGPDITSSRRITLAGENGWELLRKSVYGDDEIIVVIPHNSQALSITRGKGGYSLSHDEILSTFRFIK